MGLPKVEIPKHELTLPVLKTKVNFRPYLVKEQKVFMQALEMGDEAQVYDAIVDIVDACTYGKLDVKSLPPADLEYLLLMIRSKSSGESIEVEYVCEECGAPNRFNLNLTDVTTSGNLPDSKIMISDTVGIMMKPISYSMMQEFASNEDDESAGNALLISSIDYIFDQSQTYSTKDFSDEELIEWFDDVAGVLFENVSEYINETPEIVWKNTLTCSKCGHETEKELRGLESFLD